MTLIFGMMTVELLISCTQIIVRDLEEKAEIALQKKAFDELKVYLGELERVNPKSKRLGELYWDWYLALVKLKRQRDATGVFDDMTRIEIKYQRRISNHFLFAKKSETFLDQTTQQLYPLWLKTIGQHLNANHVCLHIMAYATNSEKKANLAQSRGKKVQRLLQKGFAEVLRKSRIISGTADEAKVELKIVDCEDLAAISLSPGVQSVALLNVALLNLEKF